MVLFGKYKILVHLITLLPYSLFHCFPSSPGLSRNCLRDCAVGRGIVMALQIW